jgi:hypothetical protein
MSAFSKTRSVLDKRLEKQAGNPVFPLNSKKLFQKPKFWNSLMGLFFFWVLVFPLFPQEDSGGGAPDPALWVGMDLPALLAGFGVPHSVYAVRGMEEWQDDVVFVYDQGDFYIFKDRVWQIGLKSAYKVQAGDSRAAALLALGEERTENRENYLLRPLPGGSWPLALRCNLDGEGKVSNIFIYRSDF